MGTGRINTVSWAKICLVFGLGKMDTGHINTASWAKILLVFGLETWLQVVSIQYPELKYTWRLDLKYGYRLYQYIGYELWLISRNDNCPFLMRYFRHCLELFSEYGMWSYTVSGKRLTPYSSKNKVVPYWGFDMLRTWNVFHLLFGEYPIWISAHI